MALLTCDLSSAGIAPSTKCRSGKVKAGAKHYGTVLKCASKAVGKGLAVDPVCGEKASGKLAKSFIKYAPGQCDGDAGAVEALVAVGLNQVTSEFMPSGPESGPSKCASSQLKAASKFASGLLKASSKNITKPDAGKLAASIAKADAKLAKDFGKSLDRGDCLASTPLTVLQSLIEETTSPISECILGTAACDGTVEVVLPAATATTDSEGDGATLSDPVETTVTSPTGGSIVILEGAPEFTPPGVRVVGTGVRIDAPVESAAAPLEIVFLVEPLATPVGTLGDDIVVARAGAVVPDCTGTPGEADPDPCVDDRTTTAAGDFAVTVLSSEASPWIVGSPGSCPNKMTLSTHGQSGDGAIDFGWAGYVHGVDAVDESSIEVFLDCPNDNGPDCGTCLIAMQTGDDGNCRCKSERRTVCDPSDGSNCPGGPTDCRCYAGTPVPVSKAGAPVCIVTEQRTGPFGTWEPATGSGSTSGRQSREIYYGATLTEPCPTCIGDVTPRDGVRDGVCSGGAFSGQSCDEGGRHAALSVSGGLSLDCLPLPGTLTTGPGSAAGDSAQATTGFTTRTAEIPCEFPFNAENCHCGVCSGNPTVACQSDFECDFLGAGTTCQPAAGFPDLHPNSCTGGSCVDVGNRRGECATDSDMYCDGLLSANGGGIIPCSNNLDCDALGPEIGACTISEPRGCYLDPAESLGQPDPVNPVVSGLSCFGATTNPSISAILGLPGLVRSEVEHGVTYKSETCPTAMTLRVRADDGLVSTASKMEMGWRGLGHGADPVGDWEMTVRLDCSASPPGVCNSCTPAGLLGTNDSCRCRFDTATSCDAPSVSDNQSCGGDSCLCYQGPPQPYVAGTPACLVMRDLNGPSGGNWHAGTGSGFMTLTPQMQVFVGESFDRPCPVCTGDAVLGDGLRDGVCLGGASDGQACDSDGYDVTLAAGDGLSLDCLPDPALGANGAGLPLSQGLTTGTALPVEFETACEAPLEGFDCACGVCAINGVTACRSDTDCGFLGGGACTTAPSAPPRKPNGCDDFMCGDSGGGVGECINGPDDSYCDGLVRPDGSGVILCLDDTDGDLYGAGDCTLVQRRRCFMDPIVAAGVADPSTPVLAGVSCQPDMGASLAINNAFGMPGPLRTSLEVELSYTE